METPKDHTTTRGGMGRNRNKQPLSHREEIKMKNPTLNNPGIRRYKGWNHLDATWHAASVGTDKANSREQALPCPPTKPGGIQGTRLIMILLWAWTVYNLCKIMMGVIKRRRFQKSNEDVNKIGRGQ